MKKLSIQIQQLLPKEKQFLYEIYTKTIKDYAYLWEEFPDIEKLRKIILFIIQLFIEEHKGLRDLSQLDQEKFKKTFRELIANHDALLQKTRRSQIKEIDVIGIESWIQTVSDDIKTINKIIEKYEQLPASKLEKLYSMIPNYDIILKGVRLGRAEFEKDVKELGFKSPHMSKVHSYEDVEVQAFVIGIPSDLNLNEIATKSYITYGAHFIDDFFDRPDLEPSVDILERHCRDIQTCLVAVRQLGTFAHRMAEKTTHPKGAYKGLHRMIYGSLIQKTSIGENQNQYLREFKKLGLQGVAPEVAQDIISIGDIAYWTTTKTVQEFMLAPEPYFDFSLAELWNLIYATALYYHDIEEEKIHGEINFTEPPTIEEMTQMIDIAKKHIRDYPDTRLSQRILQLKFLFAAFQKNFPQKIREKYKELIEYLGGISR